VLAAYATLPASSPSHSILFQPVPSQVHRLGGDATKATVPASADVHLVF
jgi:hypothetical protein